MYRQPKQQLPPLWWWVLLCSHIRNNSSLLYGGYSCVLYRKSHIFGPLSVAPLYNEMNDGESMIAFYNLHVAVANANLSFHM